MSDHQAAISASFSLDPVAAGRVLSALDSPDTPHPDQLANANLSLAVPPGYIIDRVVGSGGGGTVYRAFRDGSDRPVALKVLELRLGEGPAAQRAWRELQLLEDLHLPILPRVIDHGVHQGRLYIATEFIEGQTLDDFASSFSSPSTPSSGTGLQPVSTPSSALSHQALNPSDPQAHCLLLAKVCDAVQLLHEHGILHRDLKPSNIIIDTQGQPILIDLGIASMMEQFQGGPQQTLTETGAPIGTPAFMAPEQARGERHRISTRSDVYSLGATAYKVLTGATPHDTNTTIHEAIRRVAFDDPRDPRALDPTLPKPLAAVLSKACSREPARRYSSAAEFAADLRRWASDEPVEAVPPGAWQRAVRWAGRRPVAVTVAACVLMLAGTLALTRLSVWWYDQLPKAVTRYHDAREYRLVTRSGNPLKTWRDTSLPDKYEKFVAQRVETPSALGSDWLVVAVDPDAAKSGIGPDQLAVWNPGSLESSKWFTKPQDLTPPPPFGPHNSEYRVTNVLFADVFDNPPGVEIIAVHTRNVSPTAIRIYSLTSGTVLFEAWHRGHVNSIHWLSKPHLLIATALDKEHPLDAAKTPVVVFAIHPVVGSHLGVLNSEPRDPLTAAAIAWYKYLTPAAFVEQRLLTRLGDPNNYANRGLCVDLALQAPNGAGAVNLILNAKGEIVGSGRAEPWSATFPGLTERDFGLIDELPAVSSTNDVPHGSTQDP